MATTLDRREITDEERRAWREDGALCLRGVITPDWLRILEDGVDEAMANPSEVAKDYGTDAPGRFFTDHSMFLRFEQFRSFLYDSPLARLAAEFMGADKINLYDEHLLVKEAGTETPTWWHHDLPYFRIKGRQILSFWIPLDSVTEATGSVRFAIEASSAGRRIRGEKVTYVRIAMGLQGGRIRGRDGTRFAPPEDR